MCGRPCFALRGRVVCDGGRSNGDAANRGFGPSNPFDNANDICWSNPGCHTLFVGRNPVAMFHASLNVFVFISLYADGPDSSQKHRYAENDQAEMERAEFIKLVVIYEAIEDGGHIVEAEGKRANKSGIGKDQRLVEVPQLQ